MTMKGNINRKYYRNVTEKYNYLNTKFRTRLKEYKTSKKAKAKELLAILGKDWHEGKPITLEDKVELLVEFLDEEDPYIEKIKTLNKKLENILNDKILKLNEKDQRRLKIRVSKLESDMESMSPKSKYGALKRFIKEL